MHRVMSTFHNLVRAVIIDNDSILLARSAGATNTFLPGGHIEFGEQAEIALKRELKEETGLVAEVGEFIGAVEHIWPETTNDNHEFNLLFKVKLSGIGSKSKIQSLEPNLVFFWVSVSEAASYNLQPAPLVELINNSGNLNTAFWKSTL